MINICEIHMPRKTNYTQYCDVLGMMHQYCTLHCPSNCYTVKFCCCDDMFNVLINAHRIVGTGLEY